MNTLLPKITIEYQGTMYIEKNPRIYYALPI